MYCWGATLYGKYNDDDATAEQFSLPHCVEFNKSLDIKQIACGVTHALLLMRDGTVYSYGYNDSGQLGHDSSHQSQSNPAPVTGFGNQQIVSIAVGDQHSLALTSWGNVYSWGGNGFGQLGMVNLDNPTNLPKIIKALANKNVIQIACGSHHSLALTAGGELYSWGMNNFGQLGLGNKVSPLYEPTLVKHLVNVPLIQIAAGGQHSAALTKLGSVITWGSNKHGELGLPYELPNLEKWKSIPTIVQNIKDYSDPMKYIALGESHTVVLDSSGKLWTFGGNSYGQLGHGSFEDYNVARPICELIGTKVSQVTCGRCHTLAYTSTRNQLYSFGLGLSGQLGCISAGNTNLPQPVTGPWSDTTIDSTNYPNISAGGDSSFVVMSDNNSALDFTESNGLTLPLKIEEKHIGRLLSISDDEMMDDDLFSYCETAFNSPSCWNASFWKPGYKQFRNSFDFELAEECMAKIGRVRHDGFKSMFYNCLKTVVNNMKAYITEEELRMIVIVGLSNEFIKESNLFDLQIPFAENILNYDDEYKGSLRELLCYIPTQFTRRLVNVYRNVIIRVLKNSNPGDYVKAKILKTALKTLEFFWQHNCNHLIPKKRMLPQDFHIPEIGKLINITKDYYAWLESKEGVQIHRENVHETILFCNYYYLFDINTKTELLGVESRRQMTGAIQERYYQSSIRGELVLNPDLVTFLNLHIRRDHLVEDTIGQIRMHSKEDLKRPLKIHFRNEEAVDAGGVTKEFFLLLIREILSPDYGMFEENSETKKLWFRDSDLEMGDMFYLIGILFGLTIYNKIIINMPFPLALYKKLLKKPVDLEDLEDLDPILYKSLHSLLEYDQDDVEDVFCLKYCFEKDQFGQVVTIPLKPGSEDQSVTADNKHEYVESYVDYKLNKGIYRQFESFRGGFYQVCQGDILLMFNPDELMCLVTGNEYYDWNEFQKNTHYKGYTQNCPTIKYFWEVFHELSLDDKKKFLLFLTGTDRVPIAGMKAIQMTIQRTNEDNFLPAAHTCTSQLDLPAYSTKEKLLYKLRTAIQQCEGFGLV